jgi:hypothetical protein
MKYYEFRLADLSTFLPAMKKLYNAEKSPVISFGGSYPGNLAAWFRWGTFVTNLHSLIHYHQ